MQTNALLAIAREIIAKVPFCFAVTVADGREANARVIQPGKLHDDWSVGFMTDRRCRKVLEMERAGRLTLAYQYDPEKAYVALVGRPVMMAEGSGPRLGFPDEHPEDKMRDPEVIGRQSR